MPTDAEREKGRSASQSAVSLFATSSHKLVLSVPDTSSRRQAAPGAPVHLIQRLVDRFSPLCNDGTLLLLFRRGGPRAAPWIRTYGTQGFSGDECRRDDVEGAKE